MTVLVLGATGFIGPHVVAALAARHVDVVGASRRGAGRQGAPVDRRDVRAVKALVRQRRVTTVIDLLAYTEADTLALLHAFDGEIEHWVMASSCDVYRNYDGLHRHPTAEPIVSPLTEMSPLRTRLHPYRQAPARDPEAPDAWMDDYDKIPLEAALRARAALAGTILRLPMVFGPGDRQRRFRWAISPMLRAETVIEVDRSWLGFRATYGYVEDVADSLATAALHPAARGRTFNLGRVLPADNRGWFDCFAERTGWAGEVRETAAPDGGPLAALDLRYPLVIDTSAFRAACSWVEPTSLIDAVDRTIADEKARSGAQIG
jgi:nucleoside-diphosphate-sugar epimerase